MIRAKFKVHSITQTASWGAGGHESDTVKLVVATDDANKTWSKWTPNGSIELTINNPEALSQFKIGEYFFVDFTPAPAKEADENK
jgi:hypothetical protein